jgi:pilus assembly protein Flp/PilA
MLAQLFLWLKTFVVKDEEAQTLVEYALILVLIAIVVIAAVTAIGQGANNTFNTIANKLGGS